jgi:hypothetical protein
MFCNKFSFHNWSVWAQVASFNVTKYGDLEGKTYEYKRLCQKCGKVQHKVNHVKLTQQ